MWRQRELEDYWVKVQGRWMYARGSTAMAWTGRTPVVMVHGLGITSRYMRPAAERLAWDFPVFAPDLPGFGRSHRPGHVLDVRESAEVLLAWMDAMRIEVATLFANSVGCNVALELARTHPGRVARLVLIGPMVDANARSFPRMAWRLFLDGTREPVSLVYVALSDALRCGPRRLILTFNHFLHDRVEDKLPQIPVPTLLMSGTRDPIAPPSWTETMLGALPRGMGVILTGVCHGVHFSAPYELARLIRPFLLGEPLASLDLPLRAYVWRRPIER